MSARVTVHKVSASFLSAVMLSGCAGSWTAATDFDNGWRKAKVVELATAAAIKHKANRDCRQRMAKELVARHEFAVFEYHAGNRHRYVIAPVDEGVKLEVGDAVTVNIRDCFASVRR